MPSIVFSIIWKSNIFVFKSFYKVNRWLYILFNKFLIPIYLVWRVYKNLIFPQKAKIKSIKQ